MRSFCRNLPLPELPGPASDLDPGALRLHVGPQHGYRRPDDGAARAGRPGRHRVTGGVTLSLGLPFRADLRLNYEAYFYRRTWPPGPLRTGQGRGGVHDPFLMIRC